MLYSKDNTLCRRRDYVHKTGRVEVWPGASGRLGQLSWLGETGRLEELRWLGETGRVEAARGDWEG